MAITFVGAASAPAGGGGNPSVSLAGLSLQQGDLVIVAGAIGDNDGVNFTESMVSAGYAKVADLFANDSQDCALGVFWKFMGATPDTTAVYNGQGGTDAACAAIAAAFRGVDATTPMDVTPTTATGINSNRPNPPSINHNNPQGVWAVAVGAFAHISGTGVTATAPTNYTNTITAESANDTTDVTVAVAYRDDPVDPEDPGIFTPSIADSTSRSWCACTIALRPAVAADVTVTPTTAALVIAAFAAIVTASAHQVVTPTTHALALSTFAPAVTASNNVTVTPTTAVLSFEAFAPTVSTTANQVATPGAAALTTVAFAPTVTATANQNVTPTTAALVLETFAPAVTGGAGIIATPTTAALTLQTFAPTVTGGAGLTVTPGTATLALAAFEPTVSATTNQTVTPGVVALSTATFAPNVAVSKGTSFESRIVIGQQMSDILLGGTLNVKFTTRNSAGAPSALADGALAVYPGASVAEITAGITLSIDWDGRTGLNNVEVVASSANGYATATRYALVMTAGTVDGVSVSGYVIAEFGIEGPVLAQILQAQHCLRRKRVLDPATGIFTIYDTDGTTPLFTAQTYKDAAGTQPFDGTGRIVRTEELS